MFALTLVGVGQSVIFAAAVVAALAALAKFGKRPTRWLWKRNVAEPVGEWFDKKLDDKLEPIHAQLVANGGTSLRDAVDGCRSGLDDCKHRLGAIETQLATET